MKVKRHAEIIELINKYEIDTQEELTKRLQDAGFKVTQATVSRDIRELKLTKVSGDNGKQKYVVQFVSSNLSFDCASVVPVMNADRLCSAHTNKHRSPAFIGMQEAIPSIFAVIQMGIDGMTG